MNNILAICRLTFKEGLSHRLLYGVLVMTLLIMPLSVLVSGFFMRDIAKVLVDLCLATVSMGGLVIPFFLAVPMLAGDIERRTIFSLLSKPISRRDYLLGKFGGLTMLTAMVMTAIGGAGLLAVGAGRLLFGANFFTSFSVASYLTAVTTNFLGIALLTSLVILWCCLTTSSLLATLLTLASYLIGQTIDDIVALIETDNSQIPVALPLRYVVQTCQYLFPNLAAFDLKQAAAHGLLIPWTDAFSLGLYSLAYCTAVMTLSVFFFSRRDLV